MQQAAEATSEVQNGGGGGRGDGKGKPLATPPPKPPRVKRETAEANTNIKKSQPTTTTTAAALTQLPPPASLPSPSPTQKTTTTKKKKQLQFQSPLPNARSKARPATPVPATSAAAASNAYVKHNNNYNNNSSKNVKTIIRRVRKEEEKEAAAGTKAALRAPFMLATAAAVAIKNRLAQGCSSLMYACQHGDMAAVLEQLHAQPDRIRQRDSHNKNALHYCAAQNVQTRDLVAAASIAIAAPELLESADEDGFTPLHLAVIQGNLAMVNLLLANKADVNAVDNEGHSVVHWATVCGEMEALRSVLSSGANVATPDINGGSPLHYAAQMCGAAYDGKLGAANSSKLALEILGILVAHPQSSVDIQDKDGRQPLLWAASAGSAKAVMALVQAGARVESADKDGLTALHCAASRGHTECIDTLISLCGAPTDLIDANGCTALHYAVTLGHADATSRLLDLEADANRQDRKGRTPAHCGCSKGQFETVKLLKERGANLWLRNAKGDLPVHEAATSGRRELVAWLLEMRPNQVHTTSNDGRSLLHIAAANDYTDMCKMVLDYGADVNSVYRNSKGVVITPLDCSLQKGHRSTAKFLQSNGGLPAGKLRLAARRANPFQEATADAVRPLKYIEKEEIQDLRSSKKYVVYLKRSDSDGVEVGPGEGEGSCSCSEQTYKKEQRYAHTCRRHRKQQLRRRTSSCGEPKATCRGRDCSDICRSKSNIEIRRRKSRERHASSSEWDEEGGEEDDEDSCENCCYHKRQKQRVIRRRSTSSRRSKELKDSDDDEDERRRSDKDMSAEKQVKRAVDDVPSKDKDVNVAQEKTTEPTSRPGSKTSTLSRPQSATKRQTPPSSATKEGTFIRSPPQSAKSESEADKKLETQAQVEITDEEEEQTKVEVVTTQVDVHRDADETSLKLSEEEDRKPNAATEGEAEDLKNEVTEVITKEVDQVLKIAATAVNSSSKSSDDSLEATQKSEAQKSEIAEGQEPIPDLPQSQKAEETSAAATEAKADGIAMPTETSKTTDVIDTPATPIDKPATPIATSKLTPSPTSADASPAMAADASKATTTEDTPGKSGTEPPTQLPAALPANKPAAAKAAKTTTPEPAKPAKVETVAASAAIPKTTTSAEDPKPEKREQESRRSFTLLPADSVDEEDEEPEAEEEPIRKSSFQVLKSDDSVGELEDAPTHQPCDEETEFSDSQVFKIVSKSEEEELSAADADPGNVDYEEDEEEDEEEDGDEAASSSPVRRFQGSGNLHGRGRDSAGAEAALSPGGIIGVYDYSNGRKRRLKKRVKSGTKIRSGNWKSPNEASEGGVEAGASKDQDSGFEPSPRTLKSKIPTPRNIYTAHVPRRPIYATLDGRSCSSRFENRKPGDKAACDMSAVTRSIQRNIRRYYMERKIFQHLLELKSLQIRSNKLNEAVLVKRAVDDYHKSCAALGGETGTRLRRYSFSEFTFKNFELFLYETLKTLQKPGTYNFQNINEVYEEAERRLSPDYNAYEKALQCTTKTHRCLHAAHAYTGIPCAAYIPMMNHHTMPKFGFGAYKKTGVGSFYLPKILTSGSGCGGGKVSLELSHGKSKQLISLPSEKLDSNKRYYVTFTVKDSGSSSAGNGTSAAAGGNTSEQHNASTTATEK